MEKLITTILIVLVIGGGAFFAFNYANFTDTGPAKTIEVPEEDVEVPTVAPDKGDTVKRYDPESLTDAQGAGATPIAETGPEHAVSGLIRNRNGEPVVGAEVHLLRYVHVKTPTIGRQKIRFDEDIKATTTSDAEGKYSFEGLEEIAGPFLTLTLHHSSYISVIKDKVGPGMIVNFTLDEGARVTGIVTDIDSLKGIGEVTLDVNFKRSSGSLHDYHRWRQIVKTDSKGAFEVLGAPYGDLTILLEHPDYTRTFIGRNQKLTVKAGQDNKFDFELKKGIVLNGLVVAQDTRRPIQNADIILRDVVMAANRQRTGVLGKFRMKGVKRGARQIEINDVNGYSDYRETLDVTDETGKKPVTFELSPCGTATGIVVDDSGNPIEGADIFVAHMKSMFLMVRNLSETKSGPDGSFMVTNLNDKVTYAIAAAAPGRTLAATGRFEAVGGEQTTDLIIQCEKGASLQGRIMDDVGVPISGVNVSIEQPPFADVWFPPGLSLGQKSSFTLVTDDNGDYTCEGLYPGFYHVSPEHPDFIPVRSERFQITTATETVTKNFTLKVGHTIAGRVTDIYGNAVKGASVKAMIGVSTGQSITAQTDADGNYTLRRLEDRAYRLRASGENSVSKTKRNVPCDSSGVDMVLEDLGSMMGRVVARGTGEPVESFKVTLYPQLDLGDGKDARNERMRAKLTQSDEAFLERNVVSSSGEFRLDAVLPGDYIVEISCATHREQTRSNVNVPPGAPAQVETFALVEGARYEGVMRDSAGNPLRPGDVNIRILAAPGSAVSTDATGARSQRASTWKGKSGGLDNNGVFSIGGLPPGRVMIMFESDKYCMPARKEAQFGQSGVTREDFTVLRAASATIRVLDEDGQPIANPSAQVNNPDGSRAQADGRPVAGRGDRDGDVLIKKMEPGSYMIMVRRYGYEIQELQMTVLEGEAARSEVVLPKLR